MKNGLQVGATGSLTKSERETLLEQEKIIAKGVNEFLEVGSALLTIREKRLYRAQYPTFEEYCRTKWGFSKSAANRYISASSVASNIIDIDTEVMPTSEAQFRPLTALRPSDQQKVWKRVVEEVTIRKRPLTANIITRKIEEVLPAIHKKMTTKRKPSSRRLTQDAVESELENAFTADAEKLKGASPKEMLNWAKTTLSKLFLSVLA